MKGTVKLNREFRYAYKRGKKTVSSYIVLHYVKNGKGSNRLGITVSKLPTAVLRNRAKRLIRESYRKYLADIPGGYNFIIVARSRMADASLSDVDKAMEYCLRKSDLK